MHKFPALHMCALASILLVSVACRGSLKGVDCAAQPPEAGVIGSCVLPGHPDRDFLLQRPVSEGDGPLPVIIALHGGGGSKEGMNPLTCPDGETRHPDCLGEAAKRHGFVLVIPDGYANPLGFRSWNQGGQGPGLQCPHACEKNINDIGMLDALVAYLATLVPIDRDRVSVVGFSNGGAMAHRLACERADRYAAIAAVGGANQFAEAALCTPSRAIPILQVHGTADPCWPHAGGEGRCLAAQKGRYTSVAATIIGTDTLPGWARRHQCDGSPSIEDKRLADGFSLRSQRFRGCRAPLVQLDIVGAGHTWPGGDQYLKASRIGPVCKAFSATTAILDFFTAATPR
jgi:polyhydroxybutyrate depolymerase